jgi:hypothetical protein
MSERVVAVTIGVDTEEDLVAAEKILQQRGR